jgi:5-methylcytosine-specific restriction enzyme subunit McrC
MAPPKRVSIQEWQPSGIPFDALVQDGMDAQQASVVLTRTSSRLGKDAEAAPRFRFDGTLVRAAGIAGIVRLTPTLELEIIPKFLRAETPWQEDFFQLALLSRHTQLLSSAPVAASLHQKSDLTTIIAMNLLALIRANRRNPLRTYQIRRWFDFEVDGDLEPESFFDVSEEGFAQSLPTFSRVNPFSILIDHALRLLANEVSNPSLAAQLRNEITGPKAHAEFNPAPLRAPSRHRRWQPILDMAYLICEEFGGSLRMGRLSAPGFVLDTWRAWEDAITFAIRRSRSSSAIVRSQTVLTLGNRTRGTQTKPATTTPDVLIEQEAEILVVDAKYKGRPTDEYRVINTDLYEALAFLKAADANRAILLYPSDGLSTPDLTGTVEEFERISVDSLTVIGARVVVQGIGERGGLLRFSQMVGEWLGGVS